MHVEKETLTKVCSLGYPVEAVPGETARREQHALHQAVGLRHDGQVLVEQLPTQVGQKQVVVEQRTLGQITCRTINRKALSCENCGGCFLINIMYQSVNAVFYVCSQQGNIREII